MRVLFEFVPAGDATVVALQVESKGQTQRDTFLPYRMIPRGISCFKNEHSKPEGSADH